MYVGAMLLTWMPQVAVLINYYLTGKTVQWYLSFFAALILPAQGLFNSLIYFQKEISSCCCRRRRRQTESGRGTPSSVTNFSSLHHKMPPTSTGAVYAISTTNGGVGTVAPPESSTEGADEEDTLDGVDDDARCRQQGLIFCVKLSADRALPRNMAQNKHVFVLCLQACPYS